MRLRAQGGGKADGSKAFEKHLAHSKEPGVICWREVPSEDAPKQQNGTRKQYSKADILPHVPITGSVTKEVLRSKCNSAGIAQNKINGFIAEQIEDGVLFEWRQKRPKTNDLVSLARQPQPEQPTP